MRSILLFTARVAREAVAGDPASIVSAVQRLCRLAQQHHSFATQACNEPLNARQKHTQKRIAKEIREVCASLASASSCRTTPRGCTAKLVLPSGYTDDRAQEGFCIPLAA
jgi:hypothetical protein